MASDDVLVRVHPLSTKAAPYDVPSTPLEAKFSIPYTAAFTLLHGPPNVGDFTMLDSAAAKLAAQVVVEEDPALGQSEAVLETAAGVFTVKVALGSPTRPMNQSQVTDKIRSLTSLPVPELVRDDVPAVEALSAVFAD